MIPILLGICFIVQLLITVTPGDPARIIAGSTAEEWEYEQIREDLGLNDPFFVRFGNFLSGVLKGNLGNSFTNKRPVWDDIMARFPYTLLLATLSVGLSALIGIPLGIYAATHQYSWKDNSTVFSSLVFVSMPSFWFALLLVQYFSVELKWLPVSGIEKLQGWILPVVSLALGYTASIVRQMRSNMLEVIRQDYIVTARAKGQTERKVLYRHALKNALIPVVQTVGGLYGMALGGALISEMIFSVPGLGSYTLTGLTGRDYPIIQGSVLFLSALFCLIILLIDVVFAFIDPRIRSQYVRKKKPRKERISNESA
jgi:peptide/nickel transport system permease protein